MNYPNQASRSGNYLQDNYDDFLESQERQELVEGETFRHIEVEGEN